MLGHLDAGPGHHERARGRDVERALLIAAGALGYGANWITDWYSYDAEAKTILGLAAHENVAGFIYLGTPSEPPLERDRPNYDERIGWWSGD